MLVNLVPDKDGVIEIDAQGARAASHVPRRRRRSAEHDVSRSVTLPEPKAQFVDLRLRERPRSASGTSRSRSRSAIVPAGQAVHARRHHGSRFEAYDSLAQVYAPVRDADRTTRSWPSSRSS